MSVGIQSSYALRSDAFVLVLTQGVIHANHSLNHEDDHFVGDVQAAQGQSRFYRTQRGSLLLGAAVAIGAGFNNVSHGLGDHDDNGDVFQVRQQFHQVHAARVAPAPGTAGSARCCGYGGSMTGPLTTIPRNWQDLIGAVYQNAEKAHATRKLAGRLKWHGLDISLEHAAGDVRRGVDSDGKSWETKMQLPYGYLRGTEGADGDHLDCFVRSEGLNLDPDTEYVYIVHTTDPQTGDYDEDKCFIGFESRRDALECFRDHYTDPDKHFGAVSLMPIAEFVRHCKSGREHWKRDLVPHARAKVKLGRRVAARQQAELDERRDWLRALSKRPAEDGSPLSPVEKAIAAFGEAMEVGKATPVQQDDGDRLIMIEPGFDVIDQQGDWIPLSAIAHAWA